jgi:hypothetical protein
MCHREISTQMNKTEKLRVLPLEQTEGVKNFIRQPSALQPMVCCFLCAGSYMPAPDNPQNLNQYSYCLNNPLMYRDPSGERVRCVPIVFAPANLTADLIANDFEINFEQMAASAASRVLAGLPSGAKIASWVQDFFQNLNILGCCPIDFTCFNTNYGSPTRFFLDRAVTLTHSPYTLSDMKNKRNISLVLLLAFIANGCLIPITARKHFMVYKEPVFQGNRKYQPRVDGIYFSTNSNLAYVFYSNGLIKSLSHNTTHTVFWTNPKLASFDIYKRALSNKPNELWGEYSIHNNKIWYDYFTFNKQEFFVRQIIHAEDFMLSDTAFVINSEIATFENYELVSKPIYFRFYKTNLKPDSTYAWYLNRRWYKQEVHESRKRNIN